MLIGSLSGIPYPQFAAALAPVGAASPSFATRFQEERFSVPRPVIRQCFCGVGWGNRVR
jgi:hypothetical protein